MSQIIYSLVGIIQRDAPLKEIGQGETEFEQQQNASVQEFLKLHSKSLEIVDKLEKEFSGFRVNIEEIEKQKLSLIDMIPEIQKCNNDKIQREKTMLSSLKQLFNECTEKILFNNKNNAN